MRRLVLLTLAVLALAGAAVPPAPVLAARAPLTNLTAFRFEDGTIWVRWTSHSSPDESELIRTMPEGHTDNVGRNTRSVVKYPYTPGSFDYPEMQHGSTDPWYDTDGGGTYKIYERFYDDNGVFTDEVVTGPFEVLVITNTVKLPLVRR